MPAKAPTPISPSVDPKSPTTSVDRRTCAGISTSKTGVSVASSSLLSSGKANAVVDAGFAVVADDGAFAEEGVTTERASASERGRGASCSCLRGAGASGASPKPGGRIDSGRSWLNAGIAARTMPAAATKADRETRVSGRMNIHPHFHILGGRCQNKARKIIRYPMRAGSDTSNFTVLPINVQPLSSRRFLRRFARQALPVYRPRR